MQYEKLGRAGSRYDAHDVYIAADAKLFLGRTTPRVNMNCARGRVYIFIGNKAMDSGDAGEIKFFPNSSDISLHRAGGTLFLLPLSLSLSGNVYTSRFFIRRSI